MLEVISVFRFPEDRNVNPTNKQTKTNIFYFFNPRPLADQDWDVNTETNLMDIAMAGGWVYVLHRVRIHMSLARAV